MQKECNRCGRVMIDDFEKWKQENPTKVFAYCKKCMMWLPVMRSPGVDI